MGTKSFMCRPLFCKEAIKSVKNVYVSFVSSSSYHNYCVGLNTIPSGRWHCRECTICISCKARDPEGSDGQKSEYKWVQEFKVSPHTGNKIYSHTICLQCSRATKRNQFCPQCSVVFGKEASTSKTPAAYASCMICQRQHHLDCVGEAVFICAACQKRTLGKTIGSGNSVFQQLAIGSGVNMSVGHHGTGSPAVHAGTGGTRSRRSVIPPIVSTY